MELSELKETLRRCDALDDVENPDGSCSAVAIARMIEDPIITNSIVVDNLKLLPRNNKPEAILCATEDNIYGFSCALVSWSRFYEANKLLDGYSLREGFTIPSKYNVLVVVPLLDDSQKANQLIELAQSFNCDVIGVLALQCKVDKEHIKVPVFTLLS